MQKGNKNQNLDDFTVRLRIARELGAKARRKANGKKSKSIGTSRKPMPKRK